VPGTLVVAFALGLGRWGSYLGLPDRHIYLTDLLLVSSGLWTLVRHRSAVAITARRLWLLAPLLALGVWAIVRALVEWRVNNDVIRDLAPYVYLLVGGLALVRPGTAAGRRSVYVLMGALMVHAGWVTAAVLLPAEVADLPVLDGEVYVFSLRQDFDGAALAVLAASSLYLAMSTRRSRWSALWLLPAVWATVLIPLLANRAALLALIATCLLVGLALLRPAVRWVSRRPIPAAVALVIVLALLIVAVPQTPVYQRITGNPDFERNSADGTQQARVEAWSDVIRYTNDDTERITIGVGLGPDFLQASGGDVHYQSPGADIVRQPHNFLLNTYARLGVVGLTLLGWLLVALVMPTWRILRRRRREPLDVVRVLVVAALLVTSLVGVILESPFGAVPFAWAAGGILLSRERYLGPSHKD